MLKASKLGMECELLHATYNPSPIGGWNPSQTEPRRITYHSTPKAVKAFMGQKHATG